MSRILAWLGWQRIPVTALRIDDAREETRFWTAFAVAYVALAVGVGLVIRWHPMPLLDSVKFTDDLTYLVLFKLIVLLTLPLLWLRRRGYRVGDLLPDWRWSPRTGVTLLLVLALGLALNLGHLGPIGEAFAAADSPVLRVAVAALVPLVGAALPEEIVFRGVLQTRLEATVGRVSAVLIASLLFTAWHLPTRYLLSTGVEGTAGDLVSVLLGTGLPVFIVGLLFGWAWDRWRSLPHLVLVHWAIDLLPSISSFLGVHH